MLYYLYLIGSFLARRAPLHTGYKTAERIADIYYVFARSERRHITSNLKRVLNNSDDQTLINTYIKHIFRNFAKYLVDFFRFPKLTKSYLMEHIQVSGKENMDKARSKGKGVILLSAHLGNWELGAAVIASLGYPLYAVALSHKDVKINNFFVNHRSMADVKTIPIGMQIKNCFTILKQNKILAIIGDRDFTESGLETEFFGKKTLIPKGPAVFSLRTGAPIVPTFMIRKEDGAFRIVMEAPIDYKPTGNEDRDIKEIMRRYLSVIEEYVKMYPDQWYMFREVWNSSRKTAEAAR